MERRTFLASLLTLPTLARAAAQPPQQTEEDWLEAPGGLPPEEIERWRNAARQPIWKATTPNARRLLEAIQTGARVRITTYSGTQFQREITPSLLFQVAGYPATYVLAHCHHRQAARCFHVDRIQRVESVTPS